VVRFLEALRKRSGFANELLRNRKILAGIVIFLGMSLISVAGSYLAPYNPMRLGTFPPEMPPSFPAHILGTDSIGRDLLFLLFISILNSLQIGLAVAGFGTIFGLLVGLISAYSGGFTDSALSTVTDIALVVPMLPVLILVSSMIRVVEISTMILILIIFSWAWTSRTIRAQTLSLKERDFVYMAKLSGMGRFEIVFREITPNMISYVGVNFFGTCFWAITAEAGLSFLGLGPQTTTTLGNMLYWAQNYSSIYKGLWWAWATPIVAISVILVALYLVNIGLDEVANPKLARQRL
jgi:peptide/nickel transport system permease protein